MRDHDICFISLHALPVLAREYSHLGAGGEQVQHTLLCRALVRRGLKVAMVVLDHGQPDGAVWDGVRTIRAYRPRAGIPGLRFFHPRWSGIDAALRRADAGVYYASCAGVHLGIAAMFCGAHRRRLVFRTASNVDCQPRNLPLGNVRDRKLYEYGLRRADAVLTQTVGQQSDMVANYGVESRVAGMLVEAPARILGAGERDIDVLWVNNIATFKRPDRLVQLARDLPHRRFVMVGGPWTGHEACYESIRAAAQTCDNLEFLGRVPYQDVNDYYSRARVFVNTSDIEGFPNSYLQAWMRGTPVVTFIDPDGVIVREGLGGSPPDEVGMAAAVESLLSDDAGWNSVSGSAMAYMAREFDEDRVLKPYLDAFALGNRHDARTEEI